jgi:hypothetical protein
MALTTAVAPVQVSNAATAFASIGDGSGSAPSQKITSC